MYAMTGRVATATASRHCASTLSLRPKSVIARNEAIHCSRSKGTGVATARHIALLLAAKGCASQ
jgi:hypothetical protein